jgi:hypothetical protein
VAGDRVEPGASQPLPPLFVVRVEIHLALPGREGYAVGAKRRRKGLAQGVVVEHHHRPADRQQVAVVARHAKGLVVFPALPVEQEADGFFVFGQSTHERRRQVGSLVGTEVVNGCGRTPGSGLRGHAVALAVLRRSRIVDHEAALDGAQLAVLQHRGQQALQRLRPIAGDDHHHGFLVDRRRACQWSKFAANLARRERQTGVPERLHHLPDARRSLRRAIAALHQLPHVLVQAAERGTEAHQRLEVIAGHDQFPARARVPRQQLIGAEPEIA